MKRIVKCQALMSAIAVIYALATASCEEHVDIYDSSIRVGNVLLSDNTVVSPYGYDRDSHMAVGVIFYANEDTALVVGTKELGRHAYTDSIGTVSNVGNDVFSLCGAENTAAILSSTLHSPAVEAVKSFRSPISGWVLPSAGELRTLSRNLAVVSGSMKAVGGDAFTARQYVSSSQDGSSSDSERMYYYSVSLENGFVTSVLKSTEGCVRPVLRIR
ncbi:MAG: hypothetical protein II434_08545 [Bacteroidales bacterium]|nr:hypothetical protein [Bacteroidales bacterium]